MRALLGLPIVGIVSFVLATSFAQAQKTPTSSTSNPKVRAGRPIAPSAATTKSAPVSSAKQDSKTVVEIEVRGNRKIERDAILARIRTKAKEPLDANVVHQDVVDLFNLGYFYNIEVDEAPAAGGVKLTYFVTEKPSIGEIKFLGHSDVSEDDLKEAIGIKQFEILNYATIQTAVQKLEKLYEEKGFFLAKVKSKVEENPQGETVSLTFQIEENEKVKVKRITFLGNQKMSAGDLKSKIKTSEAGPLSFLSGSGAYRQEIFDRDVQVLNSIYFNEGFVQVKISKPEIYVTPDKKHIYITLRVEEGDQFSIGEVDFSGDLLFNREELFSAVKIKKNQTFSYEKLVGDINQLQAKYGDKGYAFANILPRTQIREKEKLVDITFEFDKGQQVYFGEINITGNTKTRDKVFRRELRVKEGELYNETNKRESLANVKRLGFFDDVVFNQKSRPDDPEKLDVDIDAKERNTGSIQLGAGFSSFQGFIINGQVQQQNLFGLGHRLGVAIDFSKVSKIFTLNYTDPYFMDTLWSAGVDVFSLFRTMLMSVFYFFKGTDIFGGYAVVVFCLLAFSWGRDFF
ncbi:MAG: outer membrane protein assembly factor BamA, partial [Bdellovibrionales bacterium]|nr:outer membrane protein assembly factor BamA [Bdellovibrionales bacterium]